MVLCVCDPYMVVTGFKALRFPQYIEALDRNHIPVTCRPHSGHSYYRYGGIHSVVFQVSVDHQETFIHVSTGWVSIMHDECFLELWTGHVCGEQALCAGSSGHVAGHSCHPTPH